MLHKYVNKVQLNEHVAQSIKNNIQASTHHVQAIGWAKKNWTVFHSNYGC